MARINKTYRRELETSLRRVAHAATVFIDGEAFKTTVFDPALGVTACADEPDRPHVQYHVDHAKFIRLKQTLYRLKRLEPVKVGIVTWRRFQPVTPDPKVKGDPANQAKMVIAMDAHPCPVRPGTWPISPAMAQAFVGETAAQEFECNGQPMLSICAPIVDSMEDVVGVVEVYGSLVGAPAKRDGLLSVETAVKPTRG